MASSSSNADQPTPKATVSGQDPPDAHVGEQSRLDEDRGVNRSVSTATSMMLASARRTRWGALRQ